MNFLEVIDFMNRINEKGITNSVFEKELRHLWLEEKITGFTYRYVLEAIGEEVSSEFKTLADYIGRYDY